jgi:hypothetical protein
LKDDKWSRILRITAIPGDTDSLFIIRIQRVPAQHLAGSLQKPRRECRLCRINLDVCDVLRFRASNGFGRDNETGLTGDRGSSG